MNSNIEILENFRDFKIKKEELDKLTKNNPNGFKVVAQIEVCNTHVITLLEKYQDGSINEKNILDWVNTIWFSEWYAYNDEQCDSIASVMNELEEIDEDGKGLTDDKVKKYLHALKNNIEL